jgi:hypothetical protein
MLQSFHPAPPSGEQWLHEVKFDGWRIQLHKHGGSAAAFTKDGHDRPGPGIGLCAVLRISMSNSSVANPPFSRSFEGRFQRGFLYGPANVGYYNSNARARVHLQKSPHAKYLT